ncbi:hypothetical protein GDO81_014822 [Engystomops pustulosus]|uniref:Ig-like domain-containing protein n=1 Tax=Engystomops pustulosus TaxID=76066 RepID=A0AAV7AF43_ENGPU|nr:hypothetical protein GDO81_014822 [Engystomops pustulosus]
MNLLHVLHIVYTISLYHQCARCRQICSEEIYIAAVEGEDVTLQINEIDVREISWLSGSSHIATSKPGQPLDVKYRKLKKRLQNSVKGSLKIIQVCMEDQGEYSANVIKEKDEECDQHFSIKVYPKLFIKDITIKSKKHDDESCSVTCNVNKPHVEIFWSNQTNHTIARNVTLKLHDIVPNSTYTCSAENPVMKVSKSIRPWTSCPRGSGSSFGPIWIPIIAIMMFLKELGL